MRAAAVRLIAVRFVFGLASLGLFACASSTDPDDDDGTAPSPITDLAVAAFTTHSVTLTWTAPGDDGDEGTADHYEVRGSDLFIVPDEFGEATLVPGAPAPSPAGITETMTIEGLGKDMTYFFAMTVYDEEGNSPGCSNCVTATSYDNSPATFADAALEAAVRAAVGIASGPLLRPDLRELHDLVAPDAGITDLGGLQECLHLRVLALGGNAVEDLSPLAGMTEMRFLVLNNSAIADLSGLADMAALEYLSVGGNEVTSIAPLAGKLHLEQVYILINAISDLGPLAELPALTIIQARYNQIEDLQPLVDNPDLGAGDLVSVEDNPLSAVATEIQIPALQQRGVEVHH